MTIDLESLREVRDYFADRQDAEQLAGESFPTPNEEMRLLVTVDSVLTELTARRARDAEAVRRQDMTTNDKLADALRNLIRAGKHLRNTVVETRGVAGMDDHDVAISDSIAALAEHDAQPTPDECFCDRMYPDSNPNASCGDCPTRDYAPKPAPAPVQVDGAGELPTLPEPTCLGFRNPCGITQLPDMGIYGYTSDQMHAYARAAIAAQQESRND